MYIQFGLIEKMIFCTKKNDDTHFRFKGEYFEIIYFTLIQAHQCKPKFKKIHCNITDI